jgi:hypothetical protein
VLIETRSAPALTRCYPHSFTFYLGNPFPRFVVNELRRASNEGTLRASVMLTVSQLSKSFASLEVRFGENGIRRVVASNRSESRWSDLDRALELANLARATSGYGRPFPNALCTDIFNRVTDTGKPIQIGRIKAKKIWIFGSFDNQRVRQRDHGIIFVSDPAETPTFWPNILVFVSRERMRRSRVYRACRCSE